MPEGLRLMAVHAHPDDESSKGAATLARYAAEGVEVTVATCTGGERGDVLNPALAGDETLRRDLASVRREEMSRAAQVLGVRQEWLGFVDSGMPETGPLPAGCFALQTLEEAAAPLVSLVRQVRPHVLITYDENGGYPHPDHIMCHKVSVEAFDAAGDAQRYPELGLTWQPQKLYYQRAFSWPRTLAIHEAVVAAGLTSPFVSWLAERAEKAPAEGEAEPPLTTRVECAGYFGARDRALLCHATQIDPDGWFFSIPRELERAVWPTEDYQLVRSLVDAPLPEDDLFLGVRQRVEAGR
jgi:mycothiol S-conjugate amidase